uniref:Uncharacterized protein n=1 Tax=Anopheles funestus TaxID=62324 RepID=A0A182S347_ANOFN
MLDCIHSGASVIGRSVERVSQYDVTLYIVHIFS